MLATGRGRADAPPASIGCCRRHDAIVALADVPTARLERLLAEHVDLCSRRLDAWITALYAQRLQRLRATNAARALHLGAFGWVENVRPAAREPLPQDALPAALRDPTGLPVFARYRTPQDAVSRWEVLDWGHEIEIEGVNVATGDYIVGDADGVAVNLSSRRMRAAIALTQVRSGQPIGALLGYQLERGLHEDHPGVELDTFIGVLRDRFPLLSGRLSEIAPGTPDELVEAQRGRWPGIAGSDRWPGLSLRDRGIGQCRDSAAAAIAAEVDRRAVPSMPYPTLCWRKVCIRPCRAT